MEVLHTIDRQLFLLINGFHDPIVDFIMYWISDRFIWIPFYCWILYQLYRLYKKQVLWFIPTMALIIVCSDQCSVFIKDHFHRFRPCHEPTLNGMVHLVNNYCGGNYGFVSSHAANSMALCTFVLMMLPKGFLVLKRELMAYVVLLAYSRIYLGAHYPGDVVGGWIVGLLVGYIFAKLLQQKVQVPVFEEDENE